VPITNESPPATVVKVSAETPVRPRSSSAARPLSVGMGSAYERFLDTPVAIVLGVMWLAGAALMGSWALVLYLVVSALI
jgi:hypothetical protein